MIPSHFSDRIKQPLNFRLCICQDYLAVSALKLVITAMVCLIKKKIKYCTYLCSLPKIIYHSMVNSTTLRKLQANHYWLVVWEIAALWIWQLRALFPALKLNVNVSIFATNRRSHRKLYFKDAVSTIELTVWQMNWEYTLSSQVSSHSFVSMDFKFACIIKANRYKPKTTERDICCLGSLYMSNWFSCFDFVINMLIFKHSIGYMVKVF